MSRKPIFSSKNLETATSLAPFRMVGAVPPSLAAWMASPKHRKVSRSGWAKDKPPQENRSSSRAGPGTRLGQKRAYWMGRRMSGAPSWAMTLWSQYSTAECNMLSRWMRIWICSGGTEKRDMASSSSSPLFMRVAESMVTLAPMDQLGCFKALAGVTEASSRRLFPKKGPPEAVRRMRLTSFPWLPCRHWKMAECSESTGTISAPFSFARAITRGPAHTRVSLLARATRLPASMAARVGSSPAMPTRAVTTVSAWGRLAAAFTPSSPARTRISVSARRCFKAEAAAESAAATRWG